MAQKQAEDIHHGAHRVHKDENRIRPVLGGLCVLCGEKSERSDVHNADMGVFTTEITEHTEMRLGFQCEQQASLGAFCVLCGKKSERFLW